MTSQIRSDNAKMEYLTAPFKVSRIALGTWAIGGWMWGGTDEHESIQTIHAALDRGINLIDTAPVPPAAAATSSSAFAANARAPSSPPTRFLDGAAVDLTIVRPAAAAPPRRLEQVGPIAGRSDRGSLG